MECPFLREARVKYCQASAFRKMIVEARSSITSERCTSPDFAGCPAAASQPAGPAGGSRCPYLQDARVEYCGAAAVTKYIPATDGLLSRCSSESHLYCELYLAHADPAGERLPETAGHRSGAGPAPLVDGMPVPAHLAYAANHLWLDVADDGYCHVGVDALFAKAIGSVDRITFVTSKSMGRPVAVLTVGDVDFQMVFPNAMGSATANLYLRTNPAKIAADPYGTGWLFEGFEPASAGRKGEGVAAGLLDGHRAAEWMQSESDRLTAFVHERLTAPEAGLRVMADGGTFTGAAPNYLGREDLINLYNEFFAPHAGWRREW